jgi:leucyl aminopeptidase
MNLKFINKKIKDIQADIEIILLKKHKLLEANNMFIKKNKLYIKIADFKYYTITEKLTNTIQYINKINKYESIKISLYGITDKKLQALIDGLLLGSYNFTKYQSKTKKLKLQNIYIANQNYKDIELSYEDIKSKIDTNIKINTNINLSRDMINSVAQDTTPIKISNWIQEELINTNIECIIKDDKYIQKELPAFHDISKGSINKPRLVHLKYNENKGYKKIVLIGKGVTFDTGGISLKPSAYMYDMRLDKAGAITIFGIIKAINDLKLPIEIHAMLGFSENMISNNAYKPGDVIKTRSGKTIEIMNTDAEGRILLADLFEYAQDKIKKIDYIFDYATLTGSVEGAIGQYSAGLIGHNIKLKNKMIKMSKKVDEWYVDLPFNRYFFDGSYKSAIADFTNTPTSSIGGGTIMGGIFIDNFLKKKYKKKWLHIDIACVSFIKKNWKYHEFGATGFGIKSSVNLIQRLTKHGIQ